MVKYVGGFVNNHEKKGKNRVTIKHIAVATQPLKCNRWKIMKQPCEISISHIGLQIVKENNIGLHFCKHYYKKVKITKSHGFLCVDDFIGYQFSTQHVPEKQAV